MIWKWKNAETRKYNNGLEYSQPVGSTLSLAVMEIWIQVLSENKTADHKEQVTKMAERISNSAINSITQVEYLQVRVSRKAA